MNSRITGTGSAFPETCYTNEYFEKFLDTSDEWIRTRTGIQTRYMIDPKKGESNTSLALKAAKAALSKADVKASDLDLIIVGTVTPDTLMPCTANQLQAELGSLRAFTFDLQAACSGFVYGLSIADQYIRSGRVQHALVIGVECLSTIVDFKDRGTSVLFGDGAGAVVISRTDSEHRIIDIRLGSDGRGGVHLNIPHGYTKVPPYSAEYRHDMRTVKMAGGEIFKFGVRIMVESCREVLSANQLTVQDIDYFLFHQANIRIVDKCLESLGVSREKTWLNVAKYGNTSSATLPVCLDEAWSAGAVKSGNLILMTTVGGGLTWGTGLIRL